MRRRDPRNTAYTSEPFQSSSHCIHFLHIVVHRIQPILPYFAFDLQIYDAFDQIPQLRQCAFTIPNFPDYDDTQVGLG